MRTFTGHETGVTHRPRETRVIVDICVFMLIFRTHGVLTSRALRLMAI